MNKINETKYCEHCGIEVGEKDGQTVHIDRSTKATIQVPAGADLFTFESQPSHLIYTHENCRPDDLMKALIKAVKKTNEILEKSAVVKK